LLQINNVDQAACGAVQHNYDFGGGSACGGGGYGGG